MIYPYECLTCKSSVDIVKSMHDASKSEFCETCKSELTRVWTSFYTTGTRVENAEYNPGLGVVTKSAKDRAEQAKRQGVVEIGNDYKSPTAIGQAFDKARKEKIDKSWEEV